MDHNTISASTLHNSSFTNFNYKSFKTKRLPIKYGKEVRQLTISTKDSKKLVLKKVYLPPLGQSYKSIHRALSS